MAGKKNLSMVQRTTNRGKKPIVIPPDQRQSNTDISGVANIQDEETIAKGKLYLDRTDKDHSWMPTGSAVLKLLFSIRLSSAIWSIISDCDEVFNYWEPLHLLLFGEGLQTWEYSPVYALRSYFYIYLHYIPANILNQILPSSKIAIFITIRCMIGFLSLSAEYYFYKAICNRLSISIGRYFILLSLMSTGMFISSTAFLPSSFSMIMNMFAMGAFLNEKWLTAVFSTGMSALVGWPFAAILGLPIAIDMLIIRMRSLSTSFISYSLITLFSIGGSMICVDSYYYGRKFLFAPMNIIQYNIFGHGPELYGVEPTSYYIKNLLLNWNLAILLVPFSIPLSIYLYIKTAKKTQSDPTYFKIPCSYSYWRRYIPVLLIFISFLTWCFIMFSQPHKEERFLFPIYPLVALLAAIAIDAINRLFSDICSALSNTIWLFITVFCVLSLSRSYSLSHNFSAHIEIYRSLNEHFVRPIQPLDFSKNGDPLTVCVGKEWHRFPSSFFLPNVVNDSNARPRKRGVHLGFLQSEFKGILPQYYPQGKLPEITSRIPKAMNDLNKEEPSRYIHMDSCDYIVDLELPDDATQSEPNYGLQADKLRRLAVHPFLISHKSHWLFRAFYIPFYSSQYNVMADYVLYQRVIPTVRR